MTEEHRDTIVILDFGSQYNQLIARRVRECNVYSVLLPYNTSLEEIKRISPKGLILTGGPASVTQRGSPKCDKGIFELGVPVLGICYGMQLMGLLLGGKVRPVKFREYGDTELSIDQRGILFEGLSNRLKVWMSHGDQVIKLPEGFKRLGHTKNSKIAAMFSPNLRFYGVQFHPEVSHTPKGLNLFKNFLYKICGCKKEWTMGSIIASSIEKIKDTVGSSRAVCALSGGVDSSVAAVLVNRAIGRNLECIFVDNALLRKGEREEVVRQFKENLGLNLHVVDARKRFLNALKGVVDPEAKRRIIGREFIRVFEGAAKRLGRIGFLVQGTLYPDVIESRSAKGGPSSTIKTHHNVGGLPKKMNLKLVEPLRDLFKDEVRLLGKELGLSDTIVYRQPFPGPGLAVRIIGEITQERLEILQNADIIVQEEIKKFRGYRELWQSFAVLLPVKSVGVMGDERTYENVVALRIVTSQDAMTADWAKLPYDILGRLSNRIINEVKGVNRVVYDISSKPPATIEWE